MSPEAAQLLVGCCISFLLGGVAGVFGLRTLYGDIPRVDPVAKAAPLVCPPPPPCPACPPPPDCGDPALSPTEGSGADAPAAGGWASAPDPVADDLPGLPASAIPVAQAAVKAQIASCLAPVAGTEGGVALLSVTVTAVGGIGEVTDAVVGRAVGVAASTTACIVEAARRARFEWSGADGRLTFRLPVSVGQ